MNFTLRIALAFAVLLAVGIAFTFERLPIDTVQRGYRGTAMDQVFNPRVIAAEASNNVVPEPEPKQDPAGQPSSAVYQNVQVLKDVDANEFLRVMAALTSWVSPEQGCNYCHNPENLAEDSVYTKVVARRMLQMTQYINTNWQSHVGPAGVTCYTCHRTYPVPRNIWFNSEGPEQASGFAETHTGQNIAAPAAAYASLPYDPFTPFLEQENNIRVNSTSALPGTNRSSIKQTEWTYALMMHFSQALGVNCTYCHNSRQFAAWEQSAPQRATAWYGIRMVRDLNANYLAGLHDVFPKTRLGTLGDVAKINCATCHQGVYKPLYGANMVADYPELGGPTAAVKSSQAETPMVAPAAIAMKAAPQGTSITQ